MEVSCAARRSAVPPYPSRLVVVTQREDELGGNTLLIVALLPQADFVALTCPLTAETEKLIDADALSRMKGGRSRHPRSQSEVLLVPLLRWAAPNSAGTNSWCRKRNFEPTERNGSWSSWLTRRPASPRAAVKNCGSVSFRYPRGASPSAGRCCAEGGAGRRCRPGASLPTSPSCRSSNGTASEHGEFPWQREPIDGRVGPASARVIS